MTLTIDQVEELLAAMKKHNQPAIVDWTNQVINVLSEEKIHPTRPIGVLWVKSNGPMIYQDYLFQLRETL